MALRGQHTRAAHFGVDFTSEEIQEHPHAFAAGEDARDHCFETAQRAIQDAGVFRYLTKPWVDTELSAHVAAAIAHNDIWLTRMSHALRGLGLEVTPGVGNFLLVHFGVARAAAADRHLLDRGIVLRRMEAYGLPGALRLTIGGEEANLAVVAALKEFVS